MPIALPNQDLDGFRNTLLSLFYSAVHNFEFAKERQELRVDPVEDLVLCLRQIANLRVFVSDWYEKREAERRSEPQQSDEIWCESAIESTLGGGIAHPKTRANVRRKHRQWLVNQKRTDPGNESSHGDLLTLIDEAISKLRALKEQSENP